MLACAFEEAPQSGLKVAVVGDGLRVPTGLPDEDRIWPLNRAQGTAMWRGAKAAYDHSPRVRAARDHFQLEAIGDDGSDVQADRVAMEIVRDPSYLAVIGHAASSTTYEGGKHYSRARLPLLMPIATSPSAVHPPGRLEVAARLPRTFRLAPADVPFQAAAVGLTLRELGASSIALIVDDTPGARRYSFPLKNAIEDYLQEQIRLQFPIDKLQAPSYSGLIDQIYGEDVDAVVFVGYASSVISLLASLRDSSNSNGSRPAVILTDGCKAPDIEKFLEGLEVYLTFPIASVARLDESQCNPDDLKILRDAVSNESEESYEMFGYDAVLLVAQAVEECVLRGLDRDCLASVLEDLSQRSFVGVCEPYSFLGGDNQHSAYYVYRSLPVQPGEKSSTSLSVWRRYSGDELRRFSNLRSRSEASEG